MGRNLYLFGKVFLLLSAAAQFFHAIISSYVGPPMTFQQSFAHWILAMNLISVVGSLFMLVYYREKKYSVAFFAGTAFTIVTFAQGIFLYTILIFVAREWMSYYFLAIALSIVTAFVYGAILIFSEAQKRPWLKAAGFLMLTIGIALVPVLMVRMVSHDMQLQTAIFKVIHGIEFAGSLLPILFALNFVAESKIPKVK